MNVRARRPVSRPGAARAAARRPCCGAQRAAPRRGKAGGARPAFLAAVPTAIQ
ncbi:transcriptional regulator [Burkholderia pseudomallei]|uniref:transcriptional regulator n=1 Tax=Burkholderia pseudomallei TaxID=28450 RepID=UPI002932FA0C|nr:transcriptional regulator [Burkholderia pseudomallei]MDV2188915.1 transcriptional regulator [Burkholderia pseudomallei]